MSPQGPKSGRGSRPGSGLSKKGKPRTGTGGKGRRALEGKGPTPPAEMRPGHPAQRKAAEFVAGRNSVVESLRAGVPSMVLYVGRGQPQDDRVAESVQLAAAAGIAVLEAGQTELDRLTGGALHQGLALRVRPYEYAHPDDLLARAEEAGQLPLLVALDSVTDPRNLGAVVRSAAAFGAHGVVVPSRRGAGVTAGAWKSSAGALAR